MPQYIGTWGVDEVTQADLVRHMVGRSIDQYFPQKTAPIGKELLRVEGLSRTGFFADVSFTLHAGEILGMTGLVGAGRTEVIEAICGVTRPSAGKIFLEGKQVDISSPHDALARGIGLLPEDRQKQGLFFILVDRAQHHACPRSDGLSKTACSTTRLNAPRRPLQRSDEDSRHLD